MSESPQRQPETAKQKSDAAPSSSQERKEQKNQVDFAAVIFAVKIEAMSRMADAGQRAASITSAELPNFNVENANAHSIEELQQFMRQAKNPVAVATVIQTMIEHPDGAKALDCVKPLLNDNDIRIYSAALAYMMTHGSVEDLPVYIKNADDVLATTTQSEKRLIADYEKNVAESIERAKVTGRGSKAHLLFDRPHESPDLFSQYTSLAQGYGASLRRGQETLPQLKKLCETSNNDTAMVMAGNQLVESSKFNEIKEMLVTSKEKTTKDALLLSMFLSIHMNPDKDTARHAEKVQQIGKLSRELLVGGTPFDAVQEQFLKKMSVEQ